MTFWMLERSNNDPHRPGHKVFATFPLGATLWVRGGPGFPWVDNAHEAKRFAFKYMAEEAWKQDWASDPVVSVKPHTWLARNDDETGPLRWAPDPDRKQVDDAPCKVCGEPIRLSFDTETLMRMCERRMCHGCSFYESIASKTEDRPTVIKGGIYWPGNGYGRKDCGMGGRRFDIEYFDGRRITTFDLWCSGVVPEAFRDRLPDTARFLGGAHRAQVGETMCFDGSDPKQPPYPLPNGKQAPWQYGEMVAQSIASYARMVLQKEDAP